MANYEEAGVKLTNTQLNKSKSEAKNKTGTTWRITKKNFQDEELPHELFLTIRQKTKIRNTFAKNKSSDIKLSKAKFSEMVDPGGFLGNIMGNLSKKVLLELVVPLTKDVLAELATKATLSVLDKFERKISRQGAIRAGRRTLFISNKDMDDVNKIVESLEKSSLWIDGATEIAKNLIKKNKKMDFWVVW